MSIYSKMSPTGKMINNFVALPVIAIALYLYWSGHDSMSWVNNLRDYLFGEDLSNRKSNKFGFAITLFSVGIPALLPSILYDFFNKTGLFDKN